MNRTKTIIETPLFQVTENFLTPDECRSLIKSAELNLKNSSVFLGSTGKREVSSIRTSNDYGLPLDHELTKVVFDKVSNILGIEKSRFEAVSIIRYQAGELFEIHSDYFNSKVDREVFHKGGQRVGTALIYLNEPVAGGETFFPRVGLVEKPKTGKMLYFQYDYGDDINSKTVHKGMPVEQGEKWVATVWIRQYPRTLLVDDVKLSDLPTISDIEYELPCGTLDSEALKLTLPGNSIYENTIIVPVSTDLRSVLLLYLLSALNSHQYIPYFILPIVVGNRSPEEIGLISKIVNRIKERTYSEFIKDPEIYKNGETISEVFLKKSSDRFYKYSYIFSNFLTDLKNIEDCVINPFSNLEKHHIDSAANELDIFDLVEQDK